MVVQWLVVEVANVLNTHMEQVPYPACHILGCVPAGWSVEVVVVEDLVVMAMILTQAAC